jgi:hypothetical protein
VGFHERRNVSCESYNLKSANPAPSALRGEKPFSATSVPFLCDLCGQTLFFAYFARPLRTSRLKAFDPPQPAEEREKLALTPKTKARGIAAGDKTFSLTSLNQSAI